MDPSNIPNSNQWFETQFRNSETVVNFNQDRALTQFVLNLLEDAVLTGESSLSLSNRTVLTDADIEKIAREPEAAPPAAPANGGPL
ncbi:unnamed protein product [Trifolium pratense]|uniref:Uncharacterized protein n=1 Tax=Trifolium pratense TaxID=57577 RepID=A0ACB0J464_TRIPR|nr:unnamed protein product [Trifolium pratense]